VNGARAGDDERAPPECAPRAVPPSRALFNLMAGSSAAQQQRSAAVCVHALPQTPTALQRPADFTPCPFAGLLFFAGTWRASAPLPTTSTVYVCLYTEPNKTIEQLVTTLFWLPQPRDATQPRLPPNQQRRPTSASRVRLSENRDIMI